MATLSQPTIFPPSLGRTYTLSGFFDLQTFVEVHFDGPWPDDIDLSRWCAVLDSSSFSDLWKSKLGSRASSVFADDNCVEPSHSSFYLVDSLDSWEIGDVVPYMRTGILAINGTVPGFFPIQWISMGIIGIFPASLLMDYSDC